MLQQARATSLGRPLSIETLQLATSWSLSPGFAKYAPVATSLVCNDHNIMCIQVADFGMARDLDEGSYYVSHGGKVPVKWTALEVDVCMYMTLK